VRRSVTSATGGRSALAVAIVLAVAGVAGCGGGRDATSASAPPAASTAPPAAATTSTPSGAAAACRAVPRPTIRLIVSHANRRTRFAARSAAAVRAGDGYAVSLVALAGGTRHMGTWFVDDLRAPRTVTSANAQALQISNWPLEAIAPAPARESGLCATRNLRGPGPLAP
jgi:hypothetical protein